MLKKSVPQTPLVSTRIRRGDTVLVRKGRSATKRGKVIRVLLEKNAVLVQGVNYVKRHTRPNPQVGRQGGVMEKEAMIRLPNVAVVCPECDKATRLARAKLDTGEWVRKCKKCGYNF